MPRSLPPILTPDFAVYIQQWVDGEYGVELLSNSVWPGIVNPTHDADCAAIGVASDEASPYWQITLITEGVFYSTFDDKPDPVIVKRAGSQPWRVIPCQRDMTTLIEGTAEAHCLIPRESPPSTFYERQAINLAAGGVLSVTPKPTTHWFWVAKGSLNGPNGVIPSLTMIKITPGKIARFTAETDVLIAHIWIHE